jgi:hypothetical protein
MKKVLFYLFISHSITFDMKNSQEAAAFAPLGQKKNLFRKPKRQKQKFRPNKI